MTKLPRIDHFVVLTLENRSFDNILGGGLYPKSAGFDDVKMDTESVKDRNGKVYTLREIPGGLSVANLTVPNPDPGELWSDINLQLFGSSQVGAVGNCNHPKPDAIADMSGFVDSYTDINCKPSRGENEAQSIMSRTPAVHLPALAQLAKSFLITHKRQPALGVNMA